ncbi:hypothetical protein Hanom_Chr01g00007091 [Helianthus anomalus]
MICFMSLIKLGVYFMPKLYIYIKPIKSNHHPNRYPPSDHAEMKSQPFKLQKITTLMVVQGGYWRFLSWWFYSTFFCP